MRTVKCTITGRVQGVFYRDSASKEAQQLGITGYIENCDNGTVETVLSGDETALETMHTWLNTGSVQAAVQKVYCKEIHYIAYEGFEVR